MSKTFKPFENFNSFFDNDIGNYFNEEKIQSTTYGFRETTTTPAPTAAAVSYGRPTYSPPTRTTPTPTSDTTTPTTPAVTPSKYETQPTPSTVFYKPIEPNDPNFTPGPFYYKPVETTPSPVQMSDATTAKTTTEGWKPKIGNYFVNPNAASKSDLFDSYGAPILNPDNNYVAPIPTTDSEPSVASKADTAPTAESYSAPTSGTYSAPTSGAYTAPTSGTYTAPTSGTYTAPASGSYTAPASESYAPPTESTPPPAPTVDASPESYNAPESVDSYGAPKAEPIDTYGTPKGEPVSAPTAAPSAAPPPPPAAPSSAKRPPKAKRPRNKLTPLGRVVNGMHIIMNDQVSRLKQVRHTPLGKSAALLLPYAATLI